MHPLNRYQLSKPNFAHLASRYPEFAPFVTISETGYASIDFKDPEALRSLTRCLLLEDWGYEVILPRDRLCPTLTNRLDYLLHVLDLEPYLGPSTSTSRLRVVDIGTGAIAIYPLLLHRLRPDAQIIGTEIDEFSYEHAKSVLEINNIPQTSIDIFKSSPSKPILFPLYPPYTDGLDESGKDRNGGGFGFTICNPPFFGSVMEMIQGQMMKVDAAHAAPTAAANELVTDGGEVRFIGQMIEESLQLGKMCSWYTSLVGKYSSLSPLVDLLKFRKIDNYFVRVIKQAKTSRWIIGWSHCTTRLPDNLTRPTDLIPHTSFFKLLPRPNTYSHQPIPAMSMEELRQSITNVLQDISLLPNEDESKDQENIILSPNRNTWSRGARRKAALGEAMIYDARAQLSALFRIRLRFVVPVEPQGGAEDGKERDGTIFYLDWEEGRDRSLVEGFWKFLLMKAELIGKRGRGDDDRSDGPLGKRVDRKGLT